MLGKTKNKLHEVIWQPDEAEKILLDFALKWFVFGTLFGGLIVSILMSL